MQRNLVIIVFFICPFAVSAEQPDGIGIGRTPSKEEIKQWDIDVMPDGTGLPKGTGTVSEGLLAYQKKCLICHGDKGVGGMHDQLVSKHDSSTIFAKDLEVVRTIGNYWPYATTLFDYIYRAMPQNSPGSLQADEVYSLVAYLLHLNGIIGYHDKINSENLANITMPARYRFYWSDEAGE